MKGDLFFFWTPERCIAPILAFQTETEKMSFHVQFEPMGFEGPAPGGQSSSTAAPKFVWFFTTKIQSQVTTNAKCSAASKNRR
jgi:hypothetical protein